MQLIGAIFFSSYYQLATFSDIFAGVTEIYSSFHRTLLWYDSYTFLPVFTLQNKLWPCVSKIEILIFQQVHFGCFDSCRIETVYLEYQIIASVCLSRAECIVCIDFFEDISIFPKILRGREDCAQKRGLSTPNEDVCAPHLKTRKSARCDGISYVLCMLYVPKNHNQSNK